MTTINAKKDLKGCVSLGCVKKQRDLFKHIMFKGLEAL
jgi:hypothetical protein